MSTSRAIRRRLLTHAARPFSRLFTPHFSRSFSTLSTSEYQHYWEQRRSQYKKFQFFVFSLPAIGPGLLALAAYAEENKKQEIIKLFGHEQLEIAAEWWTQKIKEICGTNVTDRQLKIFKLHLMREITLLKTMESLGSRSQTRFIEIPREKIFDTLEQAGINLNKHALIKMPFLLPIGKMRIYTNGYITFSDKIISTGYSTVGCDYTSSIKEIYHTPSVTLQCNKFRIIQFHEKNRFVKIELDNFCGNESEFLSLPDEELIKILETPSLSKKYIKYTACLTYSYEMKNLLEGYKSPSLGKLLVKKSDGHPNYYYHETEKPVNMMRVPSCVNGAILPTNNNPHDTLFEISEGDMIVLCEKRVSLTILEGTKNWRILNSENKEIPLKDVPSLPTPQNTHMMKITSR